MTLRDLLKLEKLRRVFKGERRHTISSFGWLRRLGARSCRAAPRADELRPATRSIAPEKLYPRGPNGGFMIWLPLKDERRPRRTPYYVLLEMAPPDPTAGREGWYAVDPRLDAIPAAAALGMPVTTFRDISRQFVSRRELGRRVYFITEELYGRDVPALERGKYPPPRPKGRRRGQHSPFCPDRQQCDGPCVPEQQQWNRRRGRSKYDKPARKAARSTNDARSTDTPVVTRQPITVAAIHAAIPPERVEQREAMYSEHADEIAQEVAASRFVPEGEEVP